MWRRIWRGVIWLVDWLGRVELVRTIMDAAWWAKLIAVVSTGGYLGWLAESVPWVFLLPQGVLLFTELVVTGDDVRPERWTCTVRGSDGVITRLEPSRSPGERSSRRRLGSSSPAPPHDRHF